jgi:hypothetical protein
MITDKSQIGGDLAGDGSIGTNSSVAIRDQFQIDNGDQTVIPYFGEVVNDEIGAVRAQGLVIQC